MPLTESDARRLLEKLTFPPLEISVVAPPWEVSPLAEAARPDTVRADWFLQLAWEGTTNLFMVEYRSRGTPREIEAALGQLRLRQVRVGEQLLPMLMTPYLSPAALDQLVTVRISGLDFSGNGVVIVPGQWFVYRSGAPNLFPASAPIKAVYAGASSLVGRVLLTAAEFRTVTAVREAILQRGGRIAVSTVSKVLRSLEEDLVIEREPRIKTIDRGKLLDRLADSYRTPRISGRAQLKADLSSEFLRILARNAESSGSNIAGSGQALYALLPTSEQVLVVYTSSIPDVVRGTEAERVQRFANLELRETDDQRIYFDRRWESDFVWTSPVQTYLELSNGTERDRQAARPIREQILEGL